MSVNSLKMRHSMQRITAHMNEEAESVERPPKQQSNVNSACMIRRALPIRRRMGRTVDNLLAMLDGDAKASLLVGRGGQNERTKRKYNGQ